MTNNLLSKNILVVGLGSMGKRRVRNLIELGAKNIYGFDTNISRSDEAKTKYNIGIFDTWEKVTKQVFDYWIISTPPLQHLGYAIEGLKSGAHIFTEADLPDKRIYEVIKLRDKTNRVAVPSCTMRYFSGPATIRRLLSENRVGKPLIMTYQTGQYLPDWHPWEDISDYYVSKAETGAAKEIVPFELSWLVELFGKVHDIKALKGKSGLIKADINDYYHILIKFDSGLAAHILVDVISRPAVRNLRLNCSEGTIEWNQEMESVRYIKHSDVAWKNIALDKGAIESGYINPDNPYADEISNFISASIKNERYPYSYEDEDYVLDMLKKIENLEYEI